MKYSFLVYQRQGMQRVKVPLFPEEFKFLGSLGDVQLSNQDHEIFFFLLKLTCFPTVTFQYHISFFQPFKFYLVCFSYGRFLKLQDSLIISFQFIYMLK